MFSKRKPIQKIQDPVAYAKAQYNQDVKVSRLYKINGVMPHKQADYGEANDCTITSMATINEYYAKPELRESFLSFYNTVLSCENPDWIYNGSKYGTLPFMIEYLMKETIKHYQKLGYMRDIKDVHTRYGKGLQYNYETIVGSLVANNPVVLNIMGDSDTDYYHDHSILVVGFREYSTDSGKKIKLLRVFDNWSISARYVDYDALPSISSINFITK